jgi:hypothetical protein
LQRLIDATAELWSGPEHLHSCLGGWVHWQIIPTDAEAVVVATLTGDANPSIRRAAMAALAKLPTISHVLAEYVRTGLADEDVFVRLHAAKAAMKATERSRALTEALMRALHDATRTVRWRAAAALAGTTEETTAARVLVESAPRATKPYSDEWVSYAEKLAPIDSRLATKPRDARATGSSNADATR